MMGIERKPDSTGILERLKDQAEGWFLWPLFGGITTVLGVLAGYLISHFDKQVGDALWPVGWPGTHFSLAATTVWIIIGLFGACFTGTFWAQARSANRVTESLKLATDLVANKTESLTVKTDTLDSLIRQLHTLPPKGFLVKYGTANRIAQNAFLSVLDSASTEAEIAAAIRTQLICVLQLASAFDQDGQNAMYGCNVMLFRNASNLSDADTARIDERMKFVDPGVTVRRLAGALEVIVDLSVSSLSNSEPDPSLESFTLPIPGSTEGKDQTVLLPGAPLAFVNRTEAAIESPADWLSKSDTFSTKVQNELKEFFESHAGQIKSFAAVPLYAVPPTSADVPEPVGVLNIHRNLPNHLLAEKLELFAPLLIPFTFGIGRGLWIYAAKSASFNGVRSNS